MKVLFFIKALNGPGGGAEKVCVEIANGLKGQGVDIEMLSFEGAGQSFYPLDPDILRHNLDVIGPVESISKGALFKIICASRAVFRARKPDIVIAFMHSAYVPAAFANLGHRRPIILSEHTEARHYATRPMQRRLRVLAERCASARTVPCEAVAVDYRSEGAFPTHVMHNPVDVVAMKQDAKQPIASQQIILSVGILRVEKNHIALVRAFGLIADKYPTWRLRLVGDGPQRHQIAQVAQDLGLEDRVEMPGISTDVSAEFARAAFTVLPSDYESFGLVAAESLAAGRPVIGLKDCAGIAEILDNEETGLLVERGHDAATLQANLAGAMRRLIEDSEMRDRMGAAGPVRVQRFGLESVVEQWKELLIRYTSKVSGGTLR